MLYLFRNVPQYHNNISILPIRSCSSLTSIVTNQQQKSPGKSFQENSGNPDLLMRQIFGKVQDTLPSH